MHEIFNTNFSSPGKYMPEFWRAMAACSRIGDAQEELPPAQPASHLSLCRLLLQGQRHESRLLPAKARILNLAVSQRANGIRVHLILLTKNTFHQIITLLILITHSNMKSTTKHHLLLWFPFLGGLSHPDAASLSVPPPRGAQASERGGRGAAAAQGTGTAGRCSLQMVTPGQRVPLAAHLPPLPTFHAPVSGVEPPRRTCWMPLNEAKAEGGLQEGDWCSPTSWWGEESRGTCREDPLSAGWPLCAGNWVAALNTYSYSNTSSTKTPTNLSSIFGPGHG